MWRFFAVVPLLVLLCVDSCGERACESPEPQLEYPTTLYPLSEQTLDSLRAVYAAQNPGVYVNLNEYGFPRSLRLSRKCGLPESVDVEGLIARAKAAIAANWQFSGVSDSSTLDLQSYSLAQRRFIAVWFGPQTYEGLLVLYTQVGVWMDSIGLLSMDGNYYREICIPQSAVVSAAEAGDSIVGLQINYYDSHGAPHTFVVTSESFRGEPYRVVFPRELVGAIELRVAWLIGVGPSESAWWYVYVDTMDGELLGADQRVHF
jgi:hypothetical protein